MDRGQWGKKGNQQDDFQKLLARPCPLHPKGKHTILECINLHKSLQERQTEEDKKKKDKQVDEDNDKDRGCTSLPTSLELMTVSTASILVLHSAEVAHLYP